MILLDLRQGSDSWQAWRRTGLGGSDAATILGVSPYEDRTPRRLWEERTGRAQCVEANFAMRRGIRLEPVARRLYEQRTGRAMRPACVRHDKLDWLLASLDGLDLWGERVLEVKCPKLELHKAALAGTVQPDWIAQIQHQLACTGAAVCDLVSYSDHSAVEEEERLAVIEVQPDPEYQREMLFAERCFWAAVEMNFWLEGQPKTGPAGCAVLPLGRAV